MPDKKTQTSESKPFEPAIPMITDGLESAQALFENGGFQVDPYKGQMVAGFTQGQNRAFASGRRAANANMDAIGGSMEAAQRAMDPARRRKAINRMQKDVLSDVMPAINGSFAGSGMTGSSLHARNLAKGVSEGFGRVRNDIYQAGENRAMQAAGMMPGLSSAMLGQTDYLRGIGGERQDFHQDQINADILRHQQGQGAEAAAIRDYLSLVGGVGGQFGTQTGTASNRPGLASIASVGVQALPFLLSDRRLKTDIRRVGQTDAGLGVYTYRYKGSETVEMGVMADEVAQVMPGAVADIGAYKAVDYGAIK